ncbi:MAG: NmrA family NAD(P)-binding protein [Woeseiaceae bacterium]|nr:NmrA family NAD(P)-binding protein [Woeseiaceae bacterium]
MKQTENHNTVSDTVLVTAGTGKIGSRIMKRLAERGVNARAGSRSARPAFDWNDRSTWDAALDNVSSVYLAYLPDLVVPGAQAAISEFVKLARTKGVQRAVLLSGRGEEEGYACEEIVRTSGMESTIVRASWFMQNFTEGDFLPMILEGVIAVPARDIPEPFVDVNDIADVVVAALTEDGHEGELYEVTGPRSMTFSEIASEISGATDRTIPFVRISRQQFAHVLTAAGAPAIISWLMDYLFGTVLDGRNAKVGDGVQRALGRNPADFRDFAKRAVDRGTWNEAVQDEVA